MLVVAIMDKHWSTSACEYESDHLLTNELYIIKS